MNLDSLFLIYGKVKAHYSDPLMPIESSLEFIFVVYFEPNKACKTWSH
jgi:hypothetical protein